MDNKIKMTWKELDRLFTNYNDIVDKNKLKNEFFTGYVVYSEKNYDEGKWDKPFPDINARTYEFSSDSKAFHSWMSGYSIFATSLDGADRGIRIEKIGWIIDYCYMNSNEYAKIIEVIEKYRKEA